MDNIFPFNQADANKFSQEELWARTSAIVQKMRIKDSLSFKWFDPIDTGRPLTPEMYDYQRELLTGVQQEQLNEYFLEFVKEFLLKEQFTLIAQQLASAKKEIFRWDEDTKRFPNPKIRYLYFRLYDSLQGQREAVVEMLKWIPLKRSLIQERWCWQPLTHNIFLSVTWVSNPYDFKENHHFGGFQVPKLEIPLNKVKVSRLFKVLRHMTDAVFEKITEKRILYRIASHLIKDCVQGGEHQNPTENHGFIVKHRSVNQKGCLQKETRRENILDYAETFKVLTMIEEFIRKKADEF